jgi:[glutamine synthetase] adenylyltransferase / [glutamine synthetase]-adenylyl-L-tyrosine phosphorylase
MRSSGLSELARHGFEDLSGTVAKLDELVGRVGDWGHSALGPLSKAASPDRALDSLLMLPPEPVAKLLAKPESALRLIRVLGASDGIASFLQRHPKALSLFTGAPRLPEASAIERLRRLEFTDVAAGRDEIRRIYRELLTATVDYDLSCEGYRNQIARVTATLSDLAAAALEAAYRLARFELGQDGRFEALDTTALSIIGMGKCGARELNYISDVDVIFVARGEGENYLDVATRLATRTMRLLDENSVEPGLWQVDANLRPEGKSGALVRTLESHVSYYQRWAENWEFQALLKARPLAGDEELGAAYIDAIKPLIWSRPNRSELVDGVRRMRARVLENIPESQREREVKLGRGGLRDIEFTVQLLQLVHGVAEPGVRAIDTLTAISELAASGFIGRDDAAKFTELYQVLRAIEHRIQLTKLRRDHLIPSDEAELRRVARSLDISLKSDSFLELFSSIRSRVVSVSDTVFYRPLLNALADLAPGEIRLSDEDVTLRLEAMGFSDPSGARRHIAALTEGVSRRSAIQRNLLPVLLRWLADGVDPDRGLLTFRRLSEELGETHWYLRMLRDNTGAAARLMRALSSSALIARLLEYIPESTSWFGDDGELAPRSQAQMLTELTALLSRHEDAQVAAESIRFVRRREILRTAIAAVSGLATLEATGKALTDISDAYLTAMLDLARREAKAPIGLEFGIIAMGRYGGGELVFGSDADCMLVYRGDAETSRFGDEVAGLLQAMVKDQLFAFDLDLDLRPEGKKGPRVRSLESYQSYYERWAEAWEFQALLRARPAVGSQDLLDDFARLADQFRYPADFSERSVVEIRRIKARVETERLPQGADPLRHLKLGRGSISDVEWLIQLYQLMHANKHPELRVVACEPAMRAMVSQQLISETDSQALLRAWRLASSIRSTAALAQERPLDVLPNDRGQLKAIARLMGFENANELEQHYLSVTRQSRAVYERLFYPAISSIDE